MSNVVSRITSLVDTIGELERYIATEQPHNSELYEARDEAIALLHNHCVVLQLERMEAKKSDNLPKSLEDIREMLLDFRGRLSREGYKTPPPINHCTFVHDKVAVAQNYIGLENVLTVLEHRVSNFNRFEGKSKTVEGMTVYQFLLEIGLKASICIDYLTAAEEAVKLCDSFKRLLDNDTRLKDRMAITSSLLNDLEPDSKLHTLLSYISTLDLEKCFLY